MGNKRNKQTSVASSKRDPVANDGSNLKNTISSQKFENAVICIAISPEIRENSSLLKFIADACKDSGLYVQVQTFCTDTQEEDRKYISISASNELISAEAEHLNYMKTRKSDEKKMEFLEVDQASFKGWNGTDSPFWLPSEQVELLWSIVNHVKASASIEEHLKHLPNTTQQVVKSHIYLMSGLRIAGLIEEIFPIHREKARAQVWQHSRFSILAPVDEIHKYFGSEVAFYFAWMNFFTCWLIVPACVGSTVYAHRIYFSYTLENHPILPLFSLFMVLWAILFIKFWKRKSVSLANEWDTLDELDEQEVRPNYHGTLMKSKITNKSILVYPEYKRIPSYLLSFVVTSVFLCIAFVVMICSLNLQGYIKGHSYSQELFQIEYLSKLSDEGALFDPNSNYAAYVPVILHVLVITSLNTCYQSIAHKLTDFENLAFEKQYQNSVIVKRFLFESFDCYIAMFYIAFFQQDITRLRFEIMSLYYTDSFRRVALESILPTLIRSISHRYNKFIKKKKNHHHQHQHGMNQVDHHHSSDQEMDLNQLKEDFDLPEYEQFDDYLEMVIEFGFIILFASSFPLCSLLSLFCNVIEIKSDLYKICFVVQRPLSKKIRDIGIWEGILQVQAWLSILTNVLIFGVTSNQMVFWFSSFFDLISNKPLNPQDVTTIIFLIEHIILMIAFVISVSISDIPSSVVAEQKRLQYEKIELVRLVRAKKLS